MVRIFLFFLIIGFVLASIVLLLYIIFGHRKLMMMYKFLTWKKEDYEKMIDEMEQWEKQKKSKKN